MSQLLAERIELWHANGNITTRTRERYESLVSNQVNRHLGARVVQSLRPIDIERWHAWMKREGRTDGAGGVAAGTARSAHRLLGEALRDAVKHGLVARNVCSRDGGEKAPKADNTEIEIIPADAIKDVVAKLLGRAVYTKVMISLFCGLRRGEVLALQWGDVDLVGKMLHVRRAVEETKAEGLRLKPPKTSAGIRAVGMPDIVLQALADLRRETFERHIGMGLGRPANDALLFPRIFDGGLQSPSAYSSDWRAAVLALKLPDVSLHALRHTHASMLIDAGVDVVRVSKRLGHANPTTTLRTYGHLFRARDDLSVEAINAVIRGS